jgi:hypothetical protein
LYLFYIILNIVILIYILLYIIYCLYLIIYIYRFKSGEDVERWQRGLTEWKDFNVDYGSIYPNGIDPDVESASVSIVGGPNSSGNNNNNRRTQQGTELNSVILDENDENEDDKGVRPLMKVIPIDSSLRLYNHIYLYIILYIIYYTLYIILYYLYLYSTLLLL